MNHKHSDVTFIVENTKIPAHKLILSTRSEYFQNLIFGDFAEANQNEIKLEVPSDAFKTVLRFFYTGCMSLSSLNANQIIDIYFLADMYILESLKETMLKYLKAIFSLENCFEILNATCLYSMHDLQEVCLKFMDRRSSKVLDHDNFKTISSNGLCTLLKRDTFYAPEIDIFNAVKTWSASNAHADSKVKYFVK